MAVHHRNFYSAFIEDVWFNLYEQFKRNITSHREFELPYEMNVYLLVELGIKKIGGYSRAENLNSYLYSVVI